MIFKKKKEAKYYKNVVYIYICEVQSLQRAHLGTDFQLL